MGSPKAKRSKRRSNDWEGIERKEVPSEERSDAVSSRSQQKRQKKVEDSGEGRFKAVVRTVDAKRGNW